MKQLIPRRRTAWLLAFALAVTLFSAPGLTVPVSADSSDKEIQDNASLTARLQSQPDPIPVLTGKVLYPSNRVYGQPLSCVVVGLPDGLTPDMLHYQWQHKVGIRDWTYLANANTSTYIPTKDDIGENVYVRVTAKADGYWGILEGSWVKISKAANEEEPSWPNLETQKDDGGSYTQFRILNYRNDHEYAYTTSSCEGWPEDGVVISSDTVTGLSQGATYYVYARYKETNTTLPGQKVVRNTVLLDDPEMLHKIVLNRKKGPPYLGDGSASPDNYIYIPLGESVTLDVTTNPGNANQWSAFTFKPEGPGMTTDIYEVTTPAGGAVGVNVKITSITIKGLKAGQATLSAEYPGYVPQYYGKWNVLVYKDASEIGTRAAVDVVTFYPDMVLQPGESRSVEQPVITVHPAGAMDRYTYEWRVTETVMNPGPGSSTTVSVTENQYLSVDPKTGKITAKKVTDDAKEYQTVVQLVAVNSSGWPEKTLTSYRVAVTEETLELTGLSVYPAQLRVGVGATYQLTAVKDPVNAPGDITWTSSNPAVAAVDKFGIVTAAAEGTAVIKATCGGKEAACTVTVALSAGHNPFTDVAEDAYYRDAVVWAVNQGITDGTGPSTFSPEDVCTRAQAVTFLWRNAGAPEPKSDVMPFADVKEGSYYHKAVLWAVEQGITKGTGAALFSPEQNCSRAQIVTFLWRAAGSPAVSGAPAFSDVAADAYYAKAVKWAEVKGITSGVGGGLFGSDDNCTRAQIVTFIYRYMEN